MNRLQRISGFSRTWWWVGGTILGLVLMIAIAAFFIEEPLRWLIEDEMNRRLHGYTVSIRELDLTRSVCRSTFET